MAYRSFDRDAAGQIRGTGGALQSDSHRFLISALIEEAITSSQLEGAATTRKVAVAMLRSGRRPRDPGEKMIFNNYRAMEHLRSTRNEKLTPEHVLELHRMLSEDTLDDPDDAGRYRRNDEVHIVDVRDNTALHIPPTIPNCRSACSACANSRMPKKRHRSLSYTPWCAPFCCIS